MKNAFLSEFNISKQRDQLMIWKGQWNGLSRLIALQTIHFNVSPTEICIIGRETETDRQTDRWLDRENTRVYGEE